MDTYEETHHDMANLPDMRTAALSNIMVILMPLAPNGSGLADIISLSNDEVRIIVAMAI